MVSGASSVWDPLDNIYVGFEGMSELYVLDGAAVSTVGASAPGAAATIYLGKSAESLGTVTVSSATTAISTLSANDTWIGLAATSTGTLDLLGDTSGRGVLATGSVVKGRATSP